MPRLFAYLRQDNSRVLIGNLLASVFGLLNFILMVRMLNKSDFGEIVIFFSAAGLADLIRTGFVRQGLVRQWIINQQRDKKSLIGSAWVLHLVIVLLIIMLCISAFAFSYYSKQNGMDIFIIYYPILLLASFPHQMTSWIAQAKKSYTLMNAFRMAVNFLFFLVLIFLSHHEVSTVEIIIYLTICHAIISFITLLFFNTIKEITHTQHKYVLSLIQFGKYSLSTLAGSNLLKSTDTLLIGLMLSTESAAIYAIPFKMIELLEIPLRGFVMTSFNTLTHLFQNGNRAGFSKHFKQHVLRLTIIFIPIATLSFFFPSIVIQLLGGAEYSDSICVMRVLSIVILLLPMDKYGGMALDSINQPHQNALKVWLMVLINGLGDLMVIYLDGTLWMIGAVTVFNISFGLFYGIFNNPFLRITVPLNKT